MGRRGSFRPLRARRMASAIAATAGFLADDPLVQRVFHAQQLFGFGFHHLVDRDAGPLGDDLGDVVHVHDFVEGVLLLPALALLFVFLFQLQPLRS